MTAVRPAGLGEGRFVAHMLKRWFGTSIEWWPEHARDTAQRILEKRLGDGLHFRSGMDKAIKICRPVESRPPPPTLRLPTGLGKPSGFPTAPQPLRRQARKLLFGG